MNKILLLEWMKCTERLKEVVDYNSNKVNCTTLVKNIVAVLRVNVACHSPPCDMDKFEDTFSHSS
jgi:hypothetical protein